MITRSTTSLLVLVVLVATVLTDCWKNFAGKPQLKRQSLRLVRATNEEIQTLL